MPGIPPNYKLDIDNVDSDTLAIMPVYLKIADAWRKYWAKRGVKMCDAYSQENRRRCIRRKDHQGLQHQYSDLGEKVEW